MTRNEIKRYEITNKMFLKERLENSLCHCHIWLSDQIYFAGMQIFMLSKKEVTGRAVPLVSGKDVSILFKTWSVNTRCPADDESEDGAAV